MIIPTPLLRYGIAVCVLALHCVCTSTYAQDTTNTPSRFSIGLYNSLDLLLLRSSISSGESVYYRPFSDSPDIREGITTGISVGYALGDNAPFPFTLTSRIAYTTPLRSRVYDQQSNVFRRVVIDGVEQDAITTEEFELEYTHTNLTLELTTSIVPYQSIPLGVEVGVSVALPLSVEYAFSNTLLSPANARFNPRDSVVFHISPDGRTAYVKKRLPEADDAQIGGIAGLRYIFLVDNIEVIPSVVYVIAKTPAADRQWSMKRLRIGADVRLRL